MKSNEFIARLRDGQVTRRQALKALGAMGVAVGAMPLGIRSAVAADNATYFTVGGYDDEGMFAPISPSMVDRQISSRTVTPRKALPR